MLLVYLISFIVGGLIGIVLHGIVPLFVILIIATMVGYAIGSIYNKIQRKKAEREYARLLEHIEAFNKKTGL